jgi:cyclophilin family peptidyl-prolyl cis-trans isomerase/HEAT repeat protein
MIRPGNTSTCALCPLWLTVFVGTVFVASVAHTRAQSLQERMLAAEDARVTSSADMAPLITGLRSTEPRVVVQAVRALGRFERPALINEILPLVTHARPEVRAEAVNALGQALGGVPAAPRSSDDKAAMAPEVALVSKTLTARIRTDSHPYVTGVAAETLGRLPYRTANEVTEAETLIASLLPPAPGSNPVAAGAQPLARVVQPATVTGAVKGLETLIRVYQKLQRPSDATLARLRGAATLGSDPSDGDFAYIRRVAWLALNGAAAADAALIERGLEDPDMQVRRLAVLALATVSADAERPGLLARALRDHSHVVRYEAVRVYGLSRAESSGLTLVEQDCAPVMAAVDDANAHVALAAIDMLGERCSGAAAKLTNLVNTLPDTGADWHRGAHAFVSLARISRETAVGHLARLSEHPTWQVRMYAARAAQIIAAAARLERLANDPHDNVREAAVQALSKVRGHEADAIYIAQLARPDYQLVMAAAKALEGSPNGARALPALVAAFARITAEKRDTSRDARVALLDRIRELGSAQQAAALEGPGKVTELPQLTLKPVPPVTAQRMRITMQRGGSFDLRLFGDEAPATIARVVGLAKKGYYNGLTFHRVVPNFVLQGGSPGANEYMGDGPFMRDELGLRGHARGTLGISTRGRDTGDAQLFINLLDNVRLDHNYTVFAEVTAGLDVVDGILEGDVIDRVDVFEPAATQSRP